MQPQTCDFRHLATSSTPESSSHPSPSGANAASRLPRQILPWPQGPADVATPSALVDRTQRRYRTNVTIACDHCKVKRVKCNGKNPCSRCLSKSLGCSYDQGNDGRRGRSSSTEVHALSEKMEQYQRLFDILRSTSPGSACRVLQRLRSQKDEAPNGSYAARDASMAQVLQYADSLTSQSTTAPDGTVPEELEQAWKQTTPINSETASTQDMAGKHNSRQSASPASPALWNGNNMFDPRFSTVSDHFTMFGLQPSVQADNGLQSGNGHNLADGRDGLVGIVQSRSPSTISQAEPPLWHPHTTTDFEQAHAWLKQDMEHIDHYLDSNLRLAKPETPRRQNR